MNEFLFEHLAKFFYDCGKLSFAGLVLTVLAKKPFIPSDLIIGLATTLILVGMAVIISMIIKKEA